jgi:NADPH:quinone reductase-like Zn-dependent oxidoreductase
VDGRDPEGNQALLAELMRLAGDGSLHPVEPTEYGLDDVVGALTDLQDRKVGGKVVLVP